MDSRRLAIDGSGEGFLFEMSRLMARFDGVEASMPGLLRLVERTCPLEGAVLVLGADSPGADTQTFGWGQPVGSARSERARARAHSVYAYFHDNLGSGFGDHVDPVAASTAYLTIPMAAPGGTVFGVLQVEGKSSLTVANVRFVDCATAELAVALARHGALLRARELAVGYARMAEIVAHDLGNPLGAIMLATDSLLRQVVPVDRRVRGRGQAALIRRAAIRMKRLIDDLRDVSAAETGRLSVQLRRVAVADVVGEAADSLRPTAALKGLAIEVDVGPGLIALCDGMRIVQVLSNLIGNAVKFARSGAIRVGAAAAPGGLIRVSVHDDGPGISARDLSHVFDRYWQLKETAHLGSGLGLSIAKDIVQSHGGSIWVESQVGVGSAFHFTLNAVSGDA